MVGRKGGREGGRVVGREEGREGGREGREIMIKGGWQKRKGGKEKG